MRLRDKPTWSMTEHLVTGAVRVLDCVYPMRGDHILPPDQDTVWFLGEGYIRVSTLLNK